MSEFNLIKQYFTRCTPITDVGIGDDAALIRVKDGYQLAISSDMLVAGTHFFADAAPFDIGWKALAVNISDMAAMGAQPKWATLALALPDKNDAWLAEFSRGFFACADAFNVDLIGGDTTRGPLNICVQIMGEVKRNQALRRSGAQVGDDIWLSGQVGNAALALAIMQNRLENHSWSKETIAQWQNALYHPKPRIALGLSLVNLAHSAIDLSDGLLSDLGHILSASQVGATLYLNQCPVDQQIRPVLHEKNIQQCVLAGGDDYELCFTAPMQARADIVRLRQTLALPLTQIGQITADKAFNVLDSNNQTLQFKFTGYDHFA